MTGSKALAPHLLHVSPRPRQAAGIVLILVALTLTGAGGAGALDPGLFPLPEKLEPNVAFWTDVYTKYDRHQVLLHDERYLHVVYAVLDFTKLDASQLSAGRKSQRKRQEIRKAETKYRTLLQNLASAKTSKGFPEEQARIEALFETVPGGRSKYSAAAGRLRTQTCLKDQFAEGIERSGVYMAAIEEIFADRGLPAELTRLPFVESLFQWKARSSAAAGGIWQFVPSTARLYRLKMDLEHDQRFDPLEATEAAAGHLEDNYASLRTWPLAITAYNHGPAGMRRAVRRLGTRDMGEIATRYRSRNFGFASRNFYAEFVAAARIYENREHYFPDATPRPALAFDEFVPERYVPIQQLAKGASTELAALKEMNPALSSAVWSGNVYLPSGYPLKVPAGRGAAFEAAFANLPESSKANHQVGHYHRVRRGETLSLIADKYGTSTSALQRANKLRSPHRISIGQKILIPPGRGGARVAGSTPVARQPTPGVHVVRRGETLSQIAEAYRVGVTQLLRSNGLKSADRIYVGQRLDVTGGSRSRNESGKKTHVVRSGETLAGIARRYGTTVGALQSVNSIRSSLIRPSQILIIP